MNRAERIYRLHALLQSRRPVPMKALMADLEMSLASVKRDIAYMRDFLRAPIEYDAEANGYRYTPGAPAFELPGLWFNESELYGLLAAEQVLESIEPGFLGPHLGPLKQRIRHLLGQGGHPAGDVARRVRLHPSNPRRLPPGLFAQAAAALLQRAILDIAYYGRGRGESTQRRIHPQRLLHYRGNWYLLAWCERAQALRTFTLENVRVEAESPGPCREVPDEELDGVMNAAFGIFAGPAQDWAVIRFDPPAARWVADEQWHGDQIGRWAGASYELRVPFSDPRELLMEVLKYGGAAEVIAPEGLRTLVRGQLEAAAARYR